MSYYSWLFDKEDSDDMTTNESQQLRNSTLTPSSHNKNALSLVGDKPYYECQDGNLDSPSAEVPAILAAMHMQTEADGMSNQKPGFHSSPFHQTSKSGHLPTVVFSTPSNEPFEYRAQSLPVTPTLDAMNLVPPDAYDSAKQSTSLPQITNGARKGFLQLISQARPCKPNGNQITPSDPLLSLSSLQHYSDLFFTRFNSSYPLIHQATFASENVHPFLVMAILLLGATYGDKEAHLLAVCLHDIMRPLIHSSKEFSTKPKLWLLQTILLVECFGKSRAGQKQHDMSHLYHGLLIK